MLAGYLHIRHGTLARRCFGADPTLLTLARCNTPDYIPLETRPRQILGSPRIYPGVDSRLYAGVDPGGSQNLPLPPSIYPPFREVSLDPRIYPSPPKYTPFSTNLYVRPSQNLPLHPRIYPPFNLPPPFSATICDPPRIYPSLSEYTPLFNNYYIMRRFRNPR